ncbi:unnamed protein product, partial [Didymodactylos carnosus]
ENLLLNMPDELLDRCSSKISDIYENIDKYLQNLIEVKMNMFHRQKLSKRLIESELGEQFCCLFEKYFVINYESNEDFETYVYKFYNQFFLYDHEILFVKKLVFELITTDKYLDEKDKNHHVYEKQSDISTFMQALSMLDCTMLFLETIIEYSANKDLEETRQEHEQLLEIFA